jgi:carboxylesterase type B
MFTGVILTESPDILAEQGHFAKIPFIIGDQEDEGTLFSLVQYNISTTADLVNYLKTIFFYDATVQQVQGLVDTYSTKPADGSPYNTGLLNEIYPQYKRVASLLGDIVFILTRRIFLNVTSTVFPGLPTWSYLASYDYGTPVLGTFHASDILTTYGITPTFASMSIQKYYISFFNTMDPNNGTTGLPAWPQWSGGNELLHFLAASNGLIKDDFRSESSAYIAKQATSFHI